MNKLHTTFLLLWPFSFFSLKPIPINTNMSPVNIKITIGNKIFTASLENNKTAEAFKNSLPLTINMIELNGNEKYGELSNPLPTASKNPGKIDVGDLMLYGNQTLVLFYKSFTTSYSYTNIAKLNHSEMLYEAIGDGNLTIKIE